MAQLRIMATGEADVSAIREETFRGRTYTVVPVVALVQSVIQGLNAEEPEFAPADEFGKFPMTWNGRPITLNHPSRDGVLTSANDPDIREEFEFGFIANTTLDDDKLKMEAWLDDEIIETKGGAFQEAKQRMLDGELVEVSTGLYCDVVESKGTYNSVKYRRAWANVVPDHLAILEAGTIGACSVADGCGAPRLNQIQGNGENALRIANPHAHTGSEKPCCEACAQGDSCMATPAANEGAEDAPTGNEVNEAGSTDQPADQSGSGEGEGGTAAAAEEAGDAGVAGAESLTPEAVTAEIEANASNAAAAAILDRLTANAIAPDITFENARSIVQTALRNAYPENGSSECGCYHYRYTYILAMNADWVAFETWNRGYESSQTIAVQYSIDSEGNVTFTGEPVPVNLITKIVPISSGEGMSANAHGGGELTGANQQQKDGHMAENNTSTTDAGAGGDVVVNGAGGSPAPRTLEAFLAEAPPEVAAVVQEGITLRTNRKKSLVSGILANSQVFTEAELEGKDIGELEKLHAMSTPKPDSFEGRANPLFGHVAGSGISANNQRDNQQTVPEAPRAFSASPVRKADYSDGNADRAVA